jgi:hypothetical protein
VARQTAQSLKKLFFFLSLHDCGGVQLHASILGGIFLASWDPGVDPDASYLGAQRLGQGPNLSRYHDELK